MERSVACTRMPARHRRHASRDRSKVARRAGPVPRTGGDRGLSILLLCVVAAGCGGGDGDGNGFPLEIEPEEVSEVVGPEGGVVEHPGGAAVEVPAGSFAAHVRVRIRAVSEPSSDLPLLSRAFEIEIATSEAGASARRAARDGDRSRGRSAARATGEYVVALDLTAPVQNVDQVGVEVTESTGSVPFYAVDVTLSADGSTAFVTTRHGYFGEEVRLVYVARRIDSSTSCQDEYRLIRAPEDLNGGLDGGPPVLFIHGWQPRFTNCENWREFDPETKGGAIFHHLNKIDLGLETQYWRYTYPTFEPIDAAAEQLAALLQERFPGRTDIVLIGHSMGGLVGRGAVHLHDANAQVARLVTLGTPHEGAELADPATWRSAGRLFVSLFFRSLRTSGASDLRPADGNDGGFIARLNAGAATEARGRYHVFAGTIDPGFDCGHGLTVCLALEEALGVLSFLELDPSDGIVRQSSALLDGAQWEQLGEGYDHFELWHGDHLAGSFSDPDVLLERVAEIVADAVRSPSVLFQDDFSGDLSQWSTFGFPEPFVDSNFGDPPPAMNVNGDASFASGASTLQTFDLGSPIRLEWSSLRPNLAIGTLFMDSNLGLFDPAPPGAAEHENCCPYYVGMSHRPDKEGGIRFWYNGTQEPSAFTITERRWIDYRIDVRADGIAEYYVDGNLVFTSPEPIVLPGDRPVVVSGRRGHIDNVVVTRLGGG